MNSDPDRVLFGADSPSSAVAAPVRATPRGPEAPLRKYGPDLDHPWILPPRAMTIALRYIEMATRRHGYSIVDQAAAIRRAEEQARRAVEETRSLQGLARRVWDAVRFSTLMSRAQLRRELLEEQRLNQVLAAVAIDSVNVLYDNLADTRRRLCAIEAAAGLPVGAAPVVKPTREVATRQGPPAKEPGAS